MAFLNFTAAEIILAFISFPCSPRVKTLAHSVADKQSKVLSLLIEDHCSVSLVTTHIGFFDTMT